MGPKAPPPSPLSSAPNRPEVELCFWCVAASNMGVMWGRKRQEVGEEQTDWETVAPQCKTQKKKEKKIQNKKLAEVQIQTFCFSVLHFRAASVWMLHVHVRTTAFCFCFYAASALQGCKFWFSKNWELESVKTVHQILEAQCIWYLVHNTNWTEPEHSNSEQCIAVKYNSINATFCIALVL